MMYFMALMDDLCGCFGMYSVQTTFLTEQTRNSLAVIAFDKERLHNAVAFGNFGPFIGTNLPPPPRKIFQGRYYSGKMT